MHLHGSIVQRDEKQAVRFMGQAAARGYVPAMYYLGVFHHDGIGTPRDRQQAAVWFGKAAEHCEPQAEYAYGMMLLAGDGVETDREEGLEMVGRAARQGYKPATDFLRRIVSYGGTQREELLGFPRGVPANGAVDDRTRFERGGLVLEQGDFTLKFSLPDLAEPPYPRVTGEEDLLDRLQGGRVEIVVPLGKGSSTAK
jgi:hypothetical protein